MKFDLECAREIMLKLEDMLEITMSLEHNFVNYEDLSAKMESYSTPVIVEHLEVLRDSDFIKADAQYGDGKVAEFLITEITLKGYEFIEKVRDNTALGKIKKFIAEHGLSALGFVISNIPH